MKPDIPQRGDIWRKAGPCGWLYIERVLMPGAADYDGGLPGCSVRISTGNGGWKQGTVFFPMHPKTWRKDMRSDCRYLAKIEDITKRWEVRQIQRLNSSVKRSPLLTKEAT